MTHLEKFIALYKEFGIECEVKTHTDGSKTIRMEGDDSGKLTGHFFFYTLVEFDKDGNFVKQGFWE